MALLLELPDLYQRMNMDFSTAAEAEKATFQMWLESIDRAVKSFCHWELTRVSASVEYYGGNGATDLPLRTPFVSDNQDAQLGTVLSVRMDQTGYYGKGTSAFAAATVLTQGQDYVMRLEGAIGKSAILVKLPSSLASGSPLIWPTSQLLSGRQGMSWSPGAVWPYGTGNIKVTCDYGFAPGSIPEDIRLAVAMGVALVRNLVQKGVVVTSEALGDYNYSGQLILQAPFATMQAYLNKYRDVQI